MYVPDYMVPLFKPHYDSSSIASTSNPVPKIIKNSNVDGNVTLEKLNCRVVVQYILRVFNLKVVRILI